MYMSVLLGHYMPLKYQHGSPIGMVLQYLMMYILAIQPVTTVEMVLQNLMV